MRRTFLIWLSAVISATFVITGLLVYAQFSFHAQERAEQMMSTRLNDMLELFLHAERSIGYLGSVNDSSTMDRTRALAEIVNLNPAILRRQEELQGICNSLGAEQIAITDENGIVEAAVPVSYVGMNLAGGDDIRPIVSYDDTGNEVVAVFSEVDRHGMQFASVDRLDKPGLVRLGFRARLEQKARMESSFNSSALRLRIGKAGRVVVYRRGVRMTSGGPSISATELQSIPHGKVRELTADDESYFLYAVEGGGYRLVGIVPTAEIYASSWRAIMVLLASNMLLFGLMFGVVSWLLQRIVLRGISRVNGTLLEITEGDLEKRVDVMDSPEFTRLSNGINFMVDSLRSVGEERQQSIKRDLELARTIQNTALPSKFPAFPHVDQFELYATCLQANEVGGDFYDFSMPDSRHLHFLVADVDAQGIPAALFMMRAMSTIRTFSRAGEDPVTVVTEANRILCEGNQAGIRMALFYGSLDITSGELLYVNAGHMHALLRRGGGEYEPLRGGMDCIMGESPDAAYHANRLQMNPGDRLLLYTEGVLHMSNSVNTPYTERRLREALQDDAPTVTDALQLVRASLRAYIGEAKMQKDVTMLCLEFCGDPSNRLSMLFTAGEPDQVTEAIARQMEEMFAAPSDIEDVQASVKAVAAALPPDMEVCLELDCTEKQAVATLLYPGAELNPLANVPDLPVHRVTFEYIDDNKLTLWKNLM